MLNKISIRKSVLLSCAAACLAALSAAGSTVQAAPSYDITGLGFPPGGKGSGATAINDSGQVVVNDGYQAFLYTNGSMTALGTLGKLGGDLGIGYAINNNGQVVGGSNTSSGEEHAFVYANGTMSDLGTLGGNLSEATGINDSGQVVGESNTSSGAYHAFVYTNGTMSDLGTLGGNFSVATGINDNGQVVGYSTATANGDQEAFLYSNGRMSALGTLGGSSSSASAINDSGQVVGGASTSSGAYDVFLYSNGTMIDLGLGSGHATGINDSGQVVGYYDINSQASPIHAFVYSNGAAYDLNNLIPSGSGWTLDEALGINNFGQVVGWGNDPAGKQEAFLLTPVPEPAALAIFALGLAGLGLSRRKTAKRSVAA